ncbi:Rrf2 family transcriptional regulator [Nocardia sp. NPDC049707]|uniref:RrF2 family transcriptional regulator n=1 Tax=Nocardia sp. NPDC049707 TaxID=3154735 RepID=UPI00341A395E
MSGGVEWAVHSCLNLFWAGPDPVSVRELAAYHELPTAYLNKRLQALCLAGVLSSRSGPRGGFQFARPADTVTVMDIVAAIEGPDNAFACQEIRRHGPDGGPPEKFPHECAVKQVFTAADLAWRRSLASRTVADIAAQAEQEAPGVGERVRAWFHRPA